MAERPVLVAGNVRHLLSAMSEAEAMMKLAADKMRPHGLTPSGYFEALGKLIGMRQHMQELAVQSVEIEPIPADRLEPANER
jgi:hypothetical protein